VGVLTFHIHYTRYPFLDSTLCCYISETFTYPTPSTLVIYYHSCYLLSSLGDAMRRRRRLEAHGRCLLFSLQPARSPLHHRHVAPLAVHIRSNQCPAPVSASVPPRYHFHLFFKSPLYIHISSFLYYLPVPKYLPIQCNYLSWRRPTDCG